jgi:hypothetical protein
MSLSLLCSSVACSLITDSRGTPCGGGRQVDAELTLPDTGLGAGGKAQVDFNESKAPSLPEASMTVWAFPPTNSMFADAPPRVRVVTDGGQVFLDLQSTTAYQGSWAARQSIPDGPIRDEIVGAFQRGIVTVEFLDASPAQKIARVRPTVLFAGTTPVLRCL